ncbi:integrase arm-type DNA-binding domain-containing protein [Methylobacterium sp. E-065]|uniref:tyrosine-type recombinase/integrase n=1 Tax=Methylobacterium sp. E-065 TaxID=2836583 RepID=UPI001FBA9F83|nr:integrase arm-type DNA-binding domain-containing protein [Methylobacterium sp. E-065]MCJ2020128.1 integrase arm-type DNA-binding domain-containing protein [Methylobacterium sp. E-065]
MQGKLTALGVARLKIPGMYGDGHGLWLQVTGSGAKSWIFRFTLRGKSREMGLGSAATFSLAEARDRARDCRKLTADGIDPIEVRRAKFQEAELEAAKAVTFKQCAEIYIEAHKASWRSNRHAKQWPSTLKYYAYPLFGDLPVQIIDTGLVMKALEPIWSTKPETATRVRGRIEAILDWATTRGYRRGENPARWKGHLANLLPRRSKVKKVAHHPALPFRQVPVFMAELRGQDTIPARALEFTILTAVRSGEALGARWVEIDMDRAIWTIPAERMKAGIEHRVPLSEPAVALLAQMRGFNDIFVFPGRRSGEPLNDKMTRDVLAKLDRTGITVHGFRSSFRDWAGEYTAFPRDLAEMALAHTVGDATERAYRRSDLFEKRRELMNAWAKICSIDKLFVFN